MTNSIPSPTGHTNAPTDVPIDVRIKMSALWASTMFVFAYVDLFSLYRSDVRAQLDAGELFVFEISDLFLFLTTLYVVIPSLMISLTLLLAPRLNRMVNLVAAAFYLITIAGGAVGEPSYWLLGSAIEVMLLVAVMYHANSLTKLAEPTSSHER